MLMLKLLFSIFVALQAYAVSFESFPEFVSLTEDELTTLEGSSQIDSKYSATTLSYQKPAIWHWNWLKSKTYFDLSVGSIDGSRFLIDNRLKFNKFLNEQFEFRFTYFQEQNLETNYLVHNLELIYWINPRWGVSAYGEVFFQKRKNDAGLAIYFKPEPNHEIKYFFSVNDFTRNDRNDLTDYFTQQPYATGIVGRKYQTHRAEFYEYAITFETPTTWIVPSSQIEYKFWRKLFSFYIQNHFQVRVEYTQKYESKYSLPTFTSTSTVGAVKTDRYLSYLRYPINQFIPGIAVSHRQWEQDTGPTALTEIIPHIIYEAGPWNLEYDLTLQKQTTEHRLVTAYEVKFSNDSHLKILATWDLKGFFNNKPWGGGNAQFYLDLP